MITDRRLMRAEPCFGLATKLWQVHWPLVLLLCALAGVGYAALYSAAGGSAEPYAGKHILRFAFGLVMMLAIAMIDIRFIARLSWPAYLGSIGLLVLVLKMGHVGKGAQRWIELGPLQLQPSELVKIALVLALAAWFHRASWQQVGNPLFLIPPVIATLIPVGLILKEPNLGTAVITGAVGAVGVLRRRRAAGGSSRWWWRRCRFWRSSSTRICTTTSARGSTRSSIPRAIRSAPATTSSSRRSRWARAACGARASCRARRAHLDFLPEKQTDFIFTMIGEEFGFVGGIAVMALLALIVLWRMVVALRCRHQYGRLVALGIASISSCMCSSTSPW